MSRKAYFKHKTPDTNNLLMRLWHFCIAFDVTTMMAGKNQAALADAHEQKLNFLFNIHEYSSSVPGENSSINLN